MDWLYCSLIRNENASPILFRMAHRKVELENSGFRSLAPQREQQSASSERQPCPEVINEINRGALSQLRYGEVKRAELLCKKAIRLCKLFMDRGFPLWWARGMIDPYINLGRLAAMRGETSTALHIYEDIYRFSVEGANIQIEDFEIPASQLLVALQSLRPDGPKAVLYEQGSTVFVCESFRALLMAGRPRDAYDFVSASFTKHVTSERPEWRFAIAELRVLAALAAGAYDEARLCLAELHCAKGERPWIEVAIALLAAEVSFWEVNLADAKIEWTKANTVLDKHVAHAQIDERNVSYLYLRIALGRMASGSLDGLDTLVAKALSYAQKCRDEIHSLKCLMILSVLESYSSGPPIYRDRLRELTMKTSYRFEKALSFYELFRISNRLGNPAGKEDLVVCYALASSIDSIQSKHFAAEIQCYGEHCGAGLLPVDHDRRDDLVDMFRSDEMERQFVALMNIWGEV